MGESAAQTVQETAFKKDIVSAIGVRAEMCVVLSVAPTGQDHSARRSRSSPVRLGPSMPGWM